MFSKCIYCILRSQWFTASQSLPRNIFSIRKTSTNPLFTETAIFEINIFFRILSLSDPSFSLVVQKAGSVSTAKSDRRFSTPLEGSSGSRLHFSSKTTLDMAASGAGDERQPAERLWKWGFRPKTATISSGSSWLVAVDLAFRAPQISHQMFQGFWRYLEIANEC